MNRPATIILIAVMTSTMISCHKQEPTPNMQQQSSFQWVVDRFADVKVMRYQVPGFENLSVQQKRLVYYLSRAALCGRDIVFDQNGKYNLAIRHTIDEIIESSTADRTTPDWDAFMIYAKRVWFANGIYHHYSNEKMLPGFSEAYFRTLVNSADAKALPLRPGKDVTDLLSIICPVMFDPAVLPRKVSQDPHKDMVVNSAGTFYQGVTEQEASAFYRAQRGRQESEPPSYGLNSTLVKEHGKLVEKTWKANGTYGPAIREIIGWLGKAATVAENETQKKVIDTLIAFYTTGDLRTFDVYSILWLKDTLSTVDFINGFIETYNDPLGFKATWEAMVNFQDSVATKRAETVAANAQWFEDHSPIDPRFKKAEVKGVSAKVITVAQLGGDSYPAPPIGINLPNADWIRTAHGSKSVTLENISYAYDQSALGDGFDEEFYSSPEEVELVRTYGSQVDNLHTDLHECVGHASGQLLPGVGTGALKNYEAVLEEARADLFALYYLLDPKLVDLGLLPSSDAAKAGYLSQMVNGLFTQLKRIEPGKDIEEAHMRNRQLIARWCLEHGKAENVIETLHRDGKTYFRINDYARLRTLFGDLLKEVQRIKSEGDYEAGKLLVETYGVKVDPALHRELLDRYARLNLAPYGGFINPAYVPVTRKGEILDVVIYNYETYEKQMIVYGKEYSFLSPW